MEALDKQRTGKKRLPLATEEQARSWLVANDVKLFADKKTLSASLKLFKEQLSLRYGMKALGELSVEHCRYFRQRLKRRRSRSTALSEKGWNRLKRGVEEVLADITNLTLSQANEIVSTQCATNKHLLRGLPSRVHVWKTPRPAN